MTGNPELTGQSCPPGRKNRNQAGQAAVSGAEVPERADAHDGIEAVLPERQGVRPGAHGRHLAGDTGRLEHGHRLARFDPPVGRLLG